MKKLKKLAAILLVAAIMLSLTACGNKPAEPQASSDAQQAAESETASTSGKQIVIGIGEAQANDEVTIRRNYLENFIGPRYNVKFIFSERLSDDSLTKEFIQNCADAGANAVIDFKTCSGLMARLCQENKMIYATNGSLTTSPELAVASDFPLYAGNVCANNEHTGLLFQNWLENVASEDGQEGFLVATMIASQGNAQHAEITRAILQGLQEKYNLKYEQDIESLVVASDTTNVANDKNILITLYPGSSARETWLPGVSSLLQTGKYGVFMSSGQTYNQSATAVAEVEKSFNMDIKVASVGSLGSTLTTAFNTNDPSGNPSVDFITVKSISVSTAALFAITYNAVVKGDASGMRSAAGEVMDFHFNFMDVNSPERLAEMEGWDEASTGKWIANEKFVDALVVTANPDVTAESIEEQLTSMSYDSIKAEMG